MIVQCLRLRFASQLSLDMQRAVSQLSLSLQTYKAEGIIDLCRWFDFGYSASCALRHPQYLTNASVLLRAIWGSQGWALRNDATSQEVDALGSSVCLAALGPFALTLAQHEFLSMFALAVSVVR